MEKPYKSAIKKTENTAAKAPKKSYLETLMERFKPKCNTNESEPDVRRRVSRHNIETRLARLEELIQTLQKEICELTNQTSVSYDEIRRDCLSRAQLSRDFTSSEGESGFSCTPCTLETVIVKGINFTPARFSEIGRKISDLHRIYDYEASGSSTGQVNDASAKLCNESAELVNDNKISGIDDDIDEIIFELKSEIRNKLGSARDFGRDLTNSKEDLT